jgi:alpha-glucosidase
VAFSEPSSVLNALIPELTPERGCVYLRDKNGLTLEVRHLEGIGWWLELRFDECDVAVRRQPLTGEQERSPLSSLSLTHTAERAEIIAGAEATLSIALDNAAFAVVEGGREIFRSSPAPFRSHREFIDVCEGVQSLKITHFEPNEFLPPMGATYPTRMTRFCYPRPQGLVLGLPGQTGEFNRNGYRFELYNTDEFVHTPARKPMYQSWPIVMHQDAAGGGWVGVFHDNPSRTFVDIGDFYPDAVTFESVTGNTRVFIITAPGLETLTQKWTRLLGAAAFPPAWAFGYQQCRWSYTSTDEVLRVASRMREERIPCDAIYFDIHHMDGYRVFTNDKKQFADLRGCIDALHQGNMRAVCIVDPGVKVDPEFAVYQEILKHGRVLQAADERPFQVRVWPGDCVLPDFFDSKTQELWADIQSRWLAEFPFDGIWNDMNEPSNFDGQNSSTSNASTAEGPIRDEWNLYGLRMVEASAAGWRKFSATRRPLIISRAGYPGVQRFAVNWQGDNQAWWEHLRLAIDASISYSLCGAHYTGIDVPGFTGNPSDDLAVRFFQLGAFLPLFRGHSIFFARDKEPYAFAPATVALLRKAIELRYSLLREWYSGFERACREGRPLIAPVVTDRGAPARDQFVLFEKLLVAPVVERDAEQRLIYLPEGRWYPLGDTTTVLSGGRWITIPVGLDSIPTFVKEGSILVRNSVREHVSATLAAPERYEVYPTLKGEASGYRYHDDLESMHDAVCERTQLRFSGGDIVCTPYPDR